MFLFLSPIQIREVSCKHFYYIVIKYHIKRRHFIVLRFMLIVDKNNQRPRHYCGIYIVYTHILYILQNITYVTTLDWRKQSKKSMTDVFPCRKIRVQNKTYRQPLTSLRSYTYQHNNLRHAIPVQLIVFLILFYLDFVSTNRFSRFY